MSLLPRANLFDTDRFLSDFWAPISGGESSSDSFFSPRVDISDHDDHYQIKAELAGIDKKDIQITLNDGVLTLQAESNKEDKEEKDGKIIRQERRQGKYMRSFNLGGDVNESDISANFKDGLLLLKIPKREEVQPAARQIDIS
jgi:HSP20 family protein